VLAWFASLFGSLLAATGARAVDLPEDRAEALFHSYSGGGVTAIGPALLIRKSIAGKVSLGASYYLDAVSNASIDVVTTASKYRETRHEYGLFADYAYRDFNVSLGATTSREPDYTATAGSIDIAQEMFGGLTTVSLGFTRSADDVKKKDSPEFSDEAKHWRYRVGVTQILTPRWIASANVEVLADSGFLGSPYRVARVFGAAVPERTPRTRSSRALKMRVIGDLGSRDSMQADYRYFYDTWGIRAHTAGLGYSRYFGGAWLAEGFVRYYTQDRASFYSDNAETETTFISRNRQLSSYSNAGVGARVSYAFGKLRNRFDTRLVGAYEFNRFSFSDFTDLRNGDRYRYNTNVLQVYLSATF